MALDYESIGKRIKRYRMDKKMSQEELGQAVHATPVYLSYIENGSRSPSLETLVLIANALDVSADDLLTDNLKHSSCIDRNIHFASFLRTHRQRIFCGHHHLSRRQPKKAGHDDSRVSSRPFHAGSLYWLYKVPSWTDRLNIRCRMHPALRYYFLLFSGIVALVANVP